MPDESFKEHCTAGPSRMRDTDLKELIERAKEGLNNASMIFKVKKRSGAQVEPIDNIDELLKIPFEEFSELDVHLFGNANNQGKAEVRINLGTNKFPKFVASGTHEAWVLGKPKQLRKFLRSKTERYRPDHRYLYIGLWLMPFLIVIAAIMGLLIGGTEWWIYVFSVGVAVFSAFIISNHRRLPRTYFDATKGNHVPRASTATFLADAVTLLANIATVIFDLFG